MAAGARPFSNMELRRTGFRDSHLLLKGSKNSNRRMAAELWRGWFWGVVTLRVPITPSIECHRLAFRKKLFFWEGTLLAFFPDFT
jgi:hypothetical protein